MTATWDSPIPPLPKLTGTIQADLCVVGLGAPALIAAGLAARLGVRVVALDAETLGEAPSARGAGLLRVAVPPEVADPARACDDVRAWLRQVVRRESSVVLAHGSRDDADDVIVDPRERCARQAELAWEDGAWLHEVEGPLERTTDGVRALQARVVAPAVLWVVERGPRGRDLAPEPAAAAGAFCQGMRLAVPGLEGTGIVELDVVPGAWGVPEAASGPGADPRSGTLVAVPWYQAWAEVLAFAWIQRYAGRGDSDLLGR